MACAIGAVGLFSLLAFGCASGHQGVRDAGSQPYDAGDGVDDAGARRDAGFDGGDALPTDAGLDAGFDSGPPPMPDSGPPPMPDSGPPPMPDAGPPPAPVTFAYTGALDTYTVPPGVSRVRIQALGASGGDSGAYLGGLGASVDAVVDVTPGETLTILVGGQPPALGHLGDGCGGSGGGGTFVVRGASTALVVAGGGGGASAYGSWANVGGHASLTPDGAGSGTLAGGAAGTGGAAVSHEGGGGGGLLGDGATGVGAGGRSFLSGGSGGARDATESCGASSPGGFGGGGGGGNDFAGGGGGYSGGAAHDPDPDTTSGGGGSYSIATGASITLRTVRGHGSVTISPM